MSSSYTVKANELTEFGAGVLRKVGVHSRAAVAAAVLAPARFDGREPLK